MNRTMRSINRVIKTVAVTGTVVMLSASLAACGKTSSATTDPEVLEDMPSITDADIDLDALNKSVESIQDLDLGPVVDDASDPVAEDSSDPEKPAAEPADESSSEVTKYSYADVTISGNDIKLVSNGGLNGSTVLYGDKDLNGFLDYVDSVVLEEGRTINRDLFYELLSFMLVDKKLVSDFDEIENNMFMALAVANNFHDTEVEIRECHLNADNAVDYHYYVTIYGKEDKWIVNYGDRTFFMNDGATEYVTEMFKNDYLAVWLMAIDDYYGIERP